MYPGQSTTRLSPHVSRQRTDLVLAHGQQIHRGRDDAAPPRASAVRLVYVERIVVAVGPGEMTDRVLASQEIVRRLGPSVGDIHPRAHSRDALVGDLAP